MVARGPAEEGLTAPAAVTRAVGPAGMQTSRTVHTGLRLARTASVRAALNHDRGPGAIDDRE